MALWTSVEDPKNTVFGMCTVPDGARWTRVEGIVQLIPTMKSLDADKKTAKAETKAVETAPEKEEVIDFSKVKVEPLFEEFVDFVYI